MIGIILIAAWAIIGVTSPITSYLIDKLKGIKDTDAKFSTGRSDMRHSNLMIIIYSTPLLVIGLVLNAIGSKM